MPRLRATLLFVCFTLAASAAEIAPKPAPNRADEPVAVKLSLDKAAVFLDGMAVAWTRERGCCTCHTNLPYLMSRSALDVADGGALAEVHSFFENRVLHWDRGHKDDAPLWDTEVVATASTLALYDARTTGKLRPTTRQALDRMWTLQKPTGEWNWLKCSWPPLEHDDYYGALFAAVGAGHAPDRYASTEKARIGIDKLRDYFRRNPAPDLHHRAWLLWAAAKLDGIMSEQDKAEAVQKLAAVQNADGGWALPALGKYSRKDGTPNDPHAPSDGYGTGLVVFALRQAGVPADDARIQRGVSWLRTHQRASGRWFTRSLNDDHAHYITDAGSSFAVMALEACGALKP